MRGTRREFDNLAAFPDIPVVTLTSGRSSLLQTEEMEKCWHMHQRELAALSIKSKHLIVADSGHYIYKGKPDDVVEAIRSIVDTARR